MESVTVLETPPALLRRALLSRRRDLLAASVLYSTHQLGESMVPVIIGATVSRAIDRGDWASIAVWLVVLAADFAFLSLSYRFGARASTLAKQHTAHTVRMWLTDRVVQPAGGIRNTPGDLLSRASSDASRVGAYAGMLAMLVSRVVVLVVATVVLLVLSPLLGAIIVVGTAVLLVVQGRVAAVLRRRSVVEQHEQARATALAEDLIRGLRVLKGIGAEQTAAADYRAVSQRATDAALHAVSSSAAVSSVAAVLSGLYLAAIAGVGGWLALGGHLGLGQLISALGLAQFVIGPMRVLAGAGAARARALASAERLVEVLDAAPAVAAPGDPGAVAEPDAALRLDAVRLVGDGPPLSLTVPPGAMVGVVCEDPAAAAAVVALLARERDPLGGRILLGTRDVAGLPLDALRTTVLVAPHDAVLLPGSIADNLGILATDPAGIDPAVRAAFADQILATVPDGGNTDVGDRGETLSGGQRQRVALARALAADPPVLVLHDPTTAVDAATEDRIAHGTADLRRGRTTLVITTSPAWLARCDQVVVVRASGSDLGTHAGLLADDPAYRDAVAR